MKKTLLLLAPLCLFALPVLAVSPAPMCTAQTTAGYWGYTCQGEVYGEPVRLLGTCTSSKGAYWDCTGTFKMSTFAAPQTLQGTATNEANCTGTIDYTVNSDNDQHLYINYVIYDHGDTIQGLPTNDGFVVSCSLKRISRPAE